MYVPAHFALDDDEALAVVERRGFGTVVVHDAQGFEATPLPWVVRRAPHLHLAGHVAAANPLVARVGDGSPAMVLVDLVDGYISPSWYASKAEHGRVVPTWNYVSVQLHGTVHVHRDPVWTRQLVVELTDHHERAMPEPWAVADAPDAYIDATLRSIVGVELRVERIVGKAKLSQNRSAADVAGVRMGLTAAGADRLVDEMVAGATRKEPA